MNQPITSAVALLLPLLSGTALADASPNPFAFTDKSNVAPSSVVTSRALVIRGIDEPTPVVVSGGTYSVGCGADASYTANNGSILSGQKICVRHSASASFSTSVDTLLTVGDKSDTFTSTSAAQDTTPTALSLIDRTGVVAGSTVTSRAIKINGTNSPSPISVTGGSYSISCSPTYTTAPSNIAPAATVCVRHVAGATPGAAVTTRLMVGGIADNFSSLVADPAAGSVSMAAFGTGAGNVRMVNPGKATSVSNPVVVDTAIPADDLDNITGFLGAAVSDTAVSNVRLAKLAYVKNGKLLVINLAAGTNNNPLLISSLADACYIEDQNEDIANPDNSWVSVDRAGADGECDSGDDVRTMVPINAAVSNPGVTPVNLRASFPINTGSGSIVGFISAEGNPPQLVQRNASFANPVTLMTLASPGMQYLSRDVRQQYLVVIPSGQTKAQLFRFDHAAQTLSPALYTFLSNGLPNIDGVAAFDNSNFYFGDGGRVLRLAHTAATTGQAAVVTTAAAGRNIQQIAIGSFGNTRLLFRAADSLGNGGIFSVLKAATAASATLLQASGFGPGGIVVPSLVTVAASGVYINVSENGVVRALRIQADGSGAVSLPQTQWAGTTFRTEFNIANSNPLDQGDPLLILRLSQSGGTGTLEAIDPANGNPVLTLGTIAGLSPFSPVFAFGLGRYAGVAAVFDRGNEVFDSDAFLVDTQTANSLRSVSGVIGKDDFPIGF